MFGRKNQPTAEQKAQEQAAWRAQVLGGNDSEGEPRWKPLKDWEAQFEPPQPPATQSYVAKKAKQVLVNQIQARISSKITTIAYETTSNVLAKAEAEATAAGLKNSLSKNSKAWNALSSVLNNMYGIVLTYRFEYHNPTKFQYLRRVASDSVAAILQKVHEEAQDAGEDIEEMRTKVTSLLESQKDRVHTFVETMLDETLQEALGNAEKKTTKKLATAKKKLTAATGDTVTALDKVAGVEATDVDPATREEIEELESNIKRRRGDIKDETVSMLSDCVRLLVLKKMDRLTVLLVYAVDKLFDAVEGLYKTQSESKLTQQQLQDNVYQVIETVHSDFQSRVSLEVQRAVCVLEAMMGDNGDEEST